MDTAWPLVGRSGHLATITAAMHQGGTAGVVVAGAAGLGKTRLATEALRHAASHGRATAWVVATQAAASMPFGAFAHLLGEAEADTASRLELLRHASRALAEQAGGRPMILAIDDAHLLDHGSAALVHHLALTTAVFLVATVRTGDPAPDAVTALWKDGLAERLELEPLGRGDVAELAEIAVGGQLDGATVEQLWRLSQGNALFLRELVTGAMQAGALVCTGGLWRATGPLATSTLLAEVIQSRLGQLSLDARAVAETVAIGEPLGAALLEAMGWAGSLEETDRAGLLDVVPDARRTVVRLAHPLYGELLRATMTPLRARLLRRRLAEALQATGARRREDLLRLVLWQLDGGVAADPRLLVRAARQARVSFFDHVLAERLAAAAVAAGAGFHAKLALAEARHALGRSREAEALLVELEASAASPQDRARVALVRANNLLRGLGDSTAAAAVIARAQDRVADPRWRDELAVLRATVDVFHGRPRQAAAAVAEVLEREGASDRVVLRALAVATSAAAFRGQVSRALAASERALGLLHRPRSELSLTADWVLTMLSVALRLAGRLDEAEDLAAERYQTAVGKRADDFRASWALALGQVALARGTAGAALRWLREAAVLLREHGAVFGTQGLAWCLGTLAQAAALRGDRATASRALAELRSVAPEHSYVPDRELAAVWLAAAQENRLQARALALEAAASAAERDAEAFEAVALHELVRLGAPEDAAERLGELAGRLEGPLAPAYAEHAVALVDRDAAALDRVCDAFFDVGATLLAAEAAAEASHWHRQAGHSASALLSAGKAGRLIRRCEGARTPALRLAGEPARLTERERQVATLAAQGLSSRAIAEQLVVSVRTVDNHLHNVYAKLGVTNRSQLREAL